jgi:3-phenylpropionate/trans-cinnamate dioxygenase ferredoxin component
MGELIRVASLSELLRERMKVADAGGREIALFGVDGTVYALNNTRPHAGFPLGEGDISEEWVICPGHSFYYNLKTGECQNDPSLKVACFEVVIEGDDVKVRL